MDMGRRKIDWVQFGILLCAMLTLLCGEFIEQGKILQSLDDVRADVAELKKQLNDAEARWQVSPHTPNLSKTAQ